MDTTAATEAALMTDRLDVAEALDRLAAAHPCRLTLCASSWYDTRHWVVTAEPWVVLGAHSTKEGALAAALATLEG